MMACNKQSSKATAHTKDQSYLSDYEIIKEIKRYVCGAQKGIIGLKQINYKFNYDALY